MKRIFFRVLALIAAVLLTVEIGAPSILALSDATLNNITNKSVCQSLHFDTFVIE